MDEAAWLEGLYQTYFDLLYDVGRRMGRARNLPADSLYDDLQEVFLTLWRKREALIDHPNIGGWLVNTLRLQIQARARKIFKAPSGVSLDDENRPQDVLEAAVAPAMPNVLDSLLYREQIKVLEKLLGRENATLFLAYALQGYSAKELAAQYHLSEASIWTRISRAKKKIVKHSDIFSIFLVVLLGLSQK